MTRLRQLMLEELQRHNYAATTREYYMCPEQRRTARYSSPRCRLIFEGDVSRS